MGNKKNNKKKRATARAAAEQKEAVAIQQCANGLYNLQKTRENIANIKAAEEAGDQEQVNCATEEGFKSHELALEAFTIAASNGPGDAADDAKFLMDNMKSKQPPSPQNYAIHTRINKCFEKYGVEDVTALINLGQMAFNGWNKRQAPDYEEAFKYFERAYLLAKKSGLSKVGDVAYKLGTMYHKGWGVKKDNKQAETLAREAITGGNTDATELLSYIIAEQAGGAKKKKPAAGGGAAGAAAEQAAGAAKSAAEPAAGGGEAAALVAAALVAERDDASKAKKKVFKQRGADHEAGQSYEDAFKSYLDAAKLGSVKAIYNMTRLLVLRKCTNDIPGKVANIITQYQPKPESATSSKNEGITKAIAALQKNNQDMKGEAVDEILNPGVIMGHLGGYCEKNDKPLDACLWYSKAARKGNIHALKAFIEMLNKGMATQSNREYSTVDILNWIKAVSDKCSDGSQDLFAMQTDPDSSGAAQGRGRLFYARPDMIDKERLERLPTTQDELREYLLQCKAQLGELEQQYSYISPGASTLG